MLTVDRWIGLGAGADDQAAGVALARPPRVVRPRVLAARPPALHRAPHAAAADLAGAARGLLPLRGDARGRVVRRRRDVPGLPGRAALARLQARAAPPRRAHRLHRGRQLAGLDVEVVDRVAPASPIPSPPCRRCTPPTRCSCCSSPAPGAGGSASGPLPTRSACGSRSSTWATTTSLDIVVGAAYAAIAWIAIPHLLRRGPAAPPARAVPAAARGRRHRAGSDVLRSGP